MEAALGGLGIQESSRYKLLKEQLQSHGLGRFAGSPRVLIFTEYRETQDALGRSLGQGFQTILFTQVSRTSRTR